MVEVFDLARKRIGLLQNAYGLSEDLNINAIGYFTFSLPFNDPKNELCKPYYYIRYNSGELYRILPSEMTITETGDVQYRCEHVLALLIDNVLFREHIVGNRGYFTHKVIQYVLGKQLVKNWQLGECDFNREFEYAWTNESLLSALFSIPKPFAENYIWVCDTKNYPYTIHLKRLDTENTKPQMYIRAKKNMLKLVKTSDPTDICTRLYPLGEGEGVNALGITSLNGGKPYLQSPQSYIDKYGVVERVWIDRRYSSQQSLYDAAAAMLKELQEPFEQYQVEFAQLGQDFYDTPAIGKVVEIVGFQKTYITGIKYNYDEMPTSELTIANKPKDIASTIANLADRQRIEMAYSQGATQFYQDHVYENATPEVSALLKIMLPSTMKIVNKVQIDVEISEFRKPFDVTGGGGGQTITQSNTSSSGGSTSTTTSSGGGQTSSSSSSNTTGAGGGTVTSTQSGGSVVSSTADGGGQLQTSDAVELLPQNITSTDTGGMGAANHNHGIPNGVHVIIKVNFEAKTFESRSFAASGAHIHAQHSHDVEINAHSHEIDIPAHSHGLNLQEHTHNMQHTHNVSAHTHDMFHTHSIEHTHSIPSHIHTLEPNISFSGNPSAFDVIINGVKVKTVTGRSLQMDITNFLLDETKKIPRDTYHKVEIAPGDAAYVQLTINVQGFIQSRGDATV